MITLLLMMDDYIALDHLIHGTYHQAESLSQKLDHIQAIGKRMSLKILTNFIK